VEVPKKTTLAPSTKKRGRVETTKKDTASEKRSRKEKLKAPRKFKSVVQPEVEQHHLNADAPQSSSQTRLEHQKFPTTSYWEIMRRHREYKKFPLIMLVLKKYMIVIQLLQTYVSQLSLLKVS
jgi:hypothetical protein